MLALSLLSLSLSLCSAAFLKTRHSDSGVQAASATRVYSFNLDDAFYYARFENYDSVSITVAASGSFDFWFTDEDNFDFWLDTDTIPTVKMYTSTYCSDCLSHTVTFTPPSSGAYYWVVSAVFPERDISGTVNVNYIGTGNYNEPVEEDDTQAVCFSGNSTVQREDGSDVQLQDLRVGESILAVDTDGSLGYSLVTAVPHGGARRNKRFSSFFQIHHAEEMDGKGPLEVTRDHLILTCPQPMEGSCSSCPAAGSDVSSSSLSPITMLTASQDVTTDMCILVADAESSHWVPVTSISRHASRKGLYSVVTQSAYPVVSGVAASPFAISHFFPHAFHAYLQPLISELMRMFFRIHPDNEGRVMAAVAEGFTKVLNFVLSGKALTYVAHGVNSAVDMVSSLRLSSGVEL